VVPEGNRRSAPCHCQDGNCEKYADRPYGHAATLKAAA
jgi:hypothetical protein